MSKIIAFTGLRGHGKDTAARALVRDYGYVQINFADPLRDVCNTVYGVTYDEMLDSILKEQVLDRWPFKSPRELLQQIGTDMFRAYIDDTWVQAWKNAVEGALRLGRYAGSVMFEEDGVTEVPVPAGVVCSDCRFINEAAMIASLGGTLIRIEDPRKRAKLKLDERSLHQSEVEIDQLQANWTITNDRGIRDLELAATCFADVDPAPPALHVLAAGARD